MTESPKGGFDEKKCWEVWNAISHPSRSPFSAYRQGAIEQWQQCQEEFKISVQELSALAGKRADDRDEYRDIALKNANEVSDLRERLSHFESENTTLNLALVDAGNQIAGKDKLLLHLLESSERVITELDSTHDFYEIHSWREDIESLTGEDFRETVSKLKGGADAL